MSLWSWLFVLVLTFVVPWISRRSPERAEAAKLSRVQIYASTSLGLWALAAVAYVVIRIDGGGLADVGIVSPAGKAAAFALVAWTVALTAAGLALFATGHAARARLALPAESGILRRIRPTRPAEALWVLLVVAPSAGICEELLYRGFFISRVAPFVTPAGAAFLAALVFGFAHAYQGWLGVVRVVMIALLLSAPVLASGSLLPAMAAHTLIDALGILWLWPLLERRWVLTGARPGSY